MHIDYPSGYSQPGQQVSGFQAHRDHDAGGDNAKVVPLSFQRRLSQSEPVVLGVNHWRDGAGETDVEGTLGVRGRSDGLGCFHGVGGAHYRETGQGAAQCQVFDAVSRHPVFSSQNTGMSAHYLDVQVGLGHQHPQLVEGPANAEHGEGADKGYFARGGQAGADSDQVLFRRPKIEEPFRVFVPPQVGEHGYVEVAP